MMTLREKLAAFVAAMNRSDWKQVISVGVPLTMDLLGNPAVEDGVLDVLPNEGRLAALLAVVNGGTQIAAQDMTADLQGRAAG